MTKPARSRSSLVRRTRTSCISWRCRSHFRSLRRARTSGPGRHRSRDRSVHGRHVQARETRSCSYATRRSAPPSPDRTASPIGSCGGSASDLGAMVSSTLRGDADLVFVPPPDQIADLGRSHAGQLHITPRPNMTYLSLNTATPPFDNIQARRALNFAIDRDAVVKLAGGDVRVACQLFPPNLPGFSPYCPYSRHPGGAWDGARLCKSPAAGGRVGNGWDEGEGVGERWCVSLGSDRSVRHAIAQAARVSTRCCTLPTSPRTTKRSESRRASGRSV